MLAGYVAHLPLFGTKPDLVSATGAGLMLAGVGIIALANVRTQSVKVESTSSSNMANSSSSDDVSSASTTEPDTADHDDDESIASFIAAEYVEFNRPEPSPVRLRRPP